MPGNCRFCAGPLNETFVDLGLSPFSNAYLEADQLDQGETFYPLHAFVCANCLLVQLEAFQAPTAIFSDYAYFSSYSSTWLNHAKTYAELMIAQLQLTQGSQVVEIASNDGYLLQYFKAQAIPVLGVEPAANVAEVANNKGIATIVKFFDEETATEMVAAGHQADLLIGNNVLAHVPHLNDFVKGMKILLKASGVITMEFPHLAQLIEQNQFDTIYHEHFSYFSLLVVEQVFKRHGLTLFDAEILPTHGGSLRIYAKHSEHLTVSVSDRLLAIKQQELKQGLDQLENYLGFADQVYQTKRKLLACLIEIKSKGKTIVGYGAPAKGNTLLNFCGIRHDFLDYTVDISPHKQGKFLPGTHLPIYAPEKIEQTQPDYVLILPWNLKQEVMQQMACIRNWGGQFIVAIPEIEIIR